MLLYLVLTYEANETLGCSLLIVFRANASESKQEHQPNQPDNHFLKQTSMNSQ
ncbi:hypothetical protein L211DRAFT_841352 [Terfezia boudieri ATCC MYA-4762]|uniref:Uncharacterized protein n=1 Tax=Terfezia boudieri ATCC MYA-4762 TaxID=1051890 RepID=A0A3N4LDS4_9PEZI|nr:hypothetical protein L211DRAFT_841352 [Terfezia boudieri ATCC MYA-4762]